MKFTKSQKMCISVIAVVLFVVGAVFAAIGANRSTSAMPTALEQPTPARKDMTAPEQAVAAGYTLSSRKEHVSAEAGRTIHDEWWARDRAPAMLTLTDDSPETQPNVLIINQAEFPPTHLWKQFVCTPERPSTDVTWFIRTAGAVYGQVTKGELHPTFRASLNDYTIQGSGVFCYGHY